MIFPEKNRVSVYPFESSEGDPFGMFMFSGREALGQPLKMITVKGEDGPPEDPASWDHVSVTINARKKRVPTWGEMCFAKNQFWGPGDIAIQFHPESEYVNTHPDCLHLWSHPSLVTPPKVCV